MFKKLLTLAAVASLCFGVKAGVVKDYEIDYTTMDSFPFYVMGYTPEFDGMMISNNPMQENEQTGDLEPAWYQYFVADGIATELGGSYTVTVTIKASEPVTFNLNMGWGWGDGQQIGKQLEVDTDWQDVELYYEEIGGSNCNLVAQPGVSLATIYWKKIVVSHEEGAGQKEPEWEEWLENGDASADWEDPDCAYNDNENNYKVCAWSKTNQQNPVPAPIEVVDGDRVFVVHATACVDPSDDASAWDNQFWIQSPKEWQAGDQFRVSFRYKASVNNVKTNTQGHHQEPSNYLIWHAIGDVTFTTEWQQFSKLVTVENDMAGMWNIAFNLNPEYKDAVDFYFDDLKWETMKLDEGWFVAGDFNGKNYDEAIELKYDDVEGYYVACFEDNSEGHGIYISTKRGNTAAFLANTIKITAPEGSDLFDEEWEDAPDETWYAFETASAKKITLPDGGVWTIYLDEEAGEIALFPAGDPSAIQGVSVDNAPAVYYNLQGVQVTNPANGIFIVKKGNKVNKQVIR